MIIISTKEFDIDGSIILHEDLERSDIRNTSRRVSRTATLDGQVNLDDAGYTDGDRIIHIFAQNIPKADYDNLQRIHRLYTTLRCATEEGLFEGVIETLSLSGGEASIRFLVSSRLDQ